MAAEYIAQRGNLDVVLCERGIRTFEPATRNTLDLSAVPIVQATSHLPVIVDPSHASGRRDLVVPLSRAGIAVGRRRADRRRPPLTRDRALRRPAGTAGHRPARARPGGAQAARRHGPGRRGATRAHGADSRVPGPIRLVLSAGDGAQGGTCPSVPSAVSRSASGGSAPTAATRSTRPGRSARRRWSPTTGAPTPPSGPPSWTSRAHHLVGSARCCRLRSRRRTRRRATRCTPTRPTGARPELAPQPPATAGDPAPSTFRHVGERPPTQRVGGLGALGSSAAVVLVLVGRARDLAAARHAATTTRRPPPTRPRPTRRDRSRGAVADRGAAAQRRSPARTTGSKPGKPEDIVRAPATADRRRRPRRRTRTSTATWSATMRATCSTAYPRRRGGWPATAPARRSPSSFAEPDHDHRGRDDQRLRQDLERRRPAASTGTPATAGCSRSSGSSTTARTRQPGLREHPQPPDASRCRQGDHADGAGPAGAGLEARVGSGRAQLHRDQRGRPCSAARAERCSTGSLRPVDGSCSPWSCSPSSLGVAVVVAVVANRPDPVDPVAQDTRGSGPAGPRVRREHRRARRTRGRAAARTAATSRWSRWSRPAPRTCGSRRRCSTARCDAPSARTGAPSVDVVGYSAGGVVVRLWVAELGGGNVARRAVTLASPHHGTDLASLGADLAPDSCPEACLQLAEDSDLLRELNAGDETPPGPAWVAIWTEDDRIVVPPDSGRPRRRRGVLRAVGLSRRDGLARRGAQRPVGDRDGRARARGGRARGADQRGVHAVGGALSAVPESPVAGPYAARGGTWSRRT